MEKRAIFPLIMFLLAGASFAFGGWQYFYSRTVQSAAQKRMAFIVTTIEKSGESRVMKQELYASIMQGLPPVPAVLGLDFSGSFASVDTGDACTSDGQRAVCLALKEEKTESAVFTAVCGACNPK